MKYLIALLLLSGCASKPFLAKQCKEIPDMKDVYACKKL